MHPLTHRLFQGDADLKAMTRLQYRLRPTNWISDYPSVVDLHELLASQESQNTTCLWLDGGELAAYALVDPYQNLLFEISPAADTPEIQSEVFNWGKTCIRRMAESDPNCLSLDASCRAEDEKRLSFLNRFGFKAEAVRSLRLEHSLNSPIPQPVLPAGFTIRPTLGPEEAQAWVDLHRAAHKTDRMTLDERLAMLAGPTYERELDLVAVAPDGRLAAYCMGVIDPEENELAGRKVGYADPVATHPDFQRRGLARALLLTCLHRLQQRGMQTAAMGTSSENEHMQQTALSAGFQIVSTRVWFSKALDE